MRLFSDPRHAFQNVNRFALGGGLTLLAGLGLWGIWLDYSFWLDELFSVTAARLPTAGMFELIFSDVHPPLYQLLLQGWVRLFGDTEGATRSLSLLFAAGTMASTLLLRPALSSVAWITYAALLAGNVYTQFYAQEVRSYELMLMLAALALALLVRRRVTLMTLALLALGLTHYFGALSAVVMAVLSLLALPGLTRPQLVVLGCMCAAIMVWPVGQVLFGSVGAMSGGSFWIQTSAVDSIFLAFETAFPPLGALLHGLDDLTGLGYRRAVAGFLLIGAIGTGAVIAATTGQIDRETLSAIRPAPRMTLALCMIPLGIVFAVAVLSLHTPLATGRNFIVLVPFAALPLALLVDELQRRSKGTAGVLAVLFALYHLGALGLSIAEVRGKVTPFQDWRTPIQTAAALAGSDSLPLYTLEIPSDSPVMARWLDLLFGYYAPDPGQLTSLPLERVGETPAPAIIVFGQESCTGAGPAPANRLTQKLDDLGLAYSVVWAQATVPCSNGYVVIEGPTPARP